MPNITRRLIFLLPVLALLNACASTPERSGAAGTGGEVAEVAMRMLGKPYRYGGNSPRGFDCSGLVHYAYAQSGASVPRSTRELRAGTRFVSVSHLQKGDLLFFNQEGKFSSHVAIYVGNNRFVHAPSGGKKVRLDTLSDPYWQRHFVDVRRF